MSDCQLDKKLIRRTKSVSGFSNGVYPIERRAGIATKFLTTISWRSRNGDETISVYDDWNLRQFSSSNLTWQFSSKRNFYINQFFPVLLNVYLTARIEIKIASLYGVS